MGCKGSTGCMDATGAKRGAEAKCAPVASIHKRGAEAKCTMVLLRGCMLGC